MLKPPEAARSRVQVVAFFITAQLAAQDTRQAFTAVVGEQLAALTGQQVPAVIDESLRKLALCTLATNKSLAVLSRAGFSGENLATGAAAAAR